VTKVLYTSRSPVISYQRCKRLRWLGYSEGEQGMGLEPVRKSSHLVVGGAVHVGLAHLLSAGQQAVDSLLQQRPDLSAAEVVGDLFRSEVVRKVEDEAVAGALAAFSNDWAGGVELDPEEAKSRQQGGPAGQPEVINDLLAPTPTPSQILTQQLRGSLQAESPIVVDFADFGQVTQAVASADLAAPAVPAYVTFDQDAWLKEELSALVEGLIRCWARRRWQGVHESYDVLEVEHEGSWKLAEWSEPVTLGFNLDGSPVVRDCELHFHSRPDALLLERSTGYLYLQSFKTTGAWDRRKELDAQVDMQGLSEAVDVERRFAEAWELIQTVRQAEHTQTVAGLMEDAEYLDAGRRVKELVSDRVAEWLRGLPDPPTILGVRYEYLLKGARREDKKAGPGEPRWNQESVLVRAYSQEGITSEDRRWAWTYDWKDEGGKGRRLDYRSWHKAAVWKSMPIRDWIDLLDAGRVQEGALDDEGNPLDALAAQLVPVVVAYRSADEMRDLLEQMESQEVQVAKDVEEVRRAEREGGAGAKRSALNRLFAQNRQACSYPGLCAYRTTATQPGFCFGGPDPFNDPGVLEHFRVREANHPQEGLVQIDAGN
jgi:hypothetical protein